MGTKSSPGLLVHLHTKKCKDFTSLAFVFAHHYLFSQLAAVLMLICQANRVLLNSSNIIYFQKVNCYLLNQTLTWDSWSPSLSEEAPDSLFQPLSHDCKLEKFTSYLLFFSKGIFPGLQITIMFLSYLSLSVSITMLNVGSVPVKTYRNLTNLVKWNWVFKCSHILSSQQIVRGI